MCGKLGRASFLRRLKNKTFDTKENYIMDLLKDFLLLKIS